MTISEIFENMDYGESLESDRNVRNWLNERKQFGHFIDGKWHFSEDNFDSFNPATGERLATLSAGNKEDIDRAVKAARKAQKTWEKSAKTRARFLYAMARQIQKHSRFIAVLETLDNGKPIHETRDADIPLAARHFYHHAGWAQLSNQEFTNTQAHGVVGQIISWNFPFLMLAWKIAPALAAGNTVVLKPAEETSLSALFFAQICEEIELPRGVVNIVTGDGQTGAILTANEDIDKLAFTGSTEVGKEIQKQSVKKSRPLTLELGGKSPFIVFEDADLDSAVEGAVRAIWYNQGEVCCAGSRALLHESIAEKFTEKLKWRMSKLRVGNPLDKSIDIGALVSQTQKEKIEQMVKEGTNMGGNHHIAACDLPQTGAFMAPQIIADIAPAHPLFDREIFGPILVTTRFRTEKEAIELANNSRYGLAASLWSETLDQCLSVVPKLRAGVVWINSHNMFDAAAEFGGVKESGFGREGGRNGMLEYLKSNARLPEPITLKIKKETTDTIDITRKFFIGGKQTRPDSGYSKAIAGAEIGVGNRKDLRNAVEAMRQSSWQKSNAHNRAQVLYYLAENLSRRRTQFENTLALALDKKLAKIEVESAIDSIMTFAAFADKNEGKISAVPQRAVALSLNEATGNIGILAREGAPFAEPLRAISAALAMGNCVTIIAPDDFPLAVLDCAGLAESSDLPAGCLNILSGSPKELGQEMAAHAGLDALWDFQGLGNHLEDAHKNVKRVFSPNQLISDQDILRAGVDVKSVWLPYGALY